MRRLIAGAFAVVAAVLSAQSTAAAEKNPFEIPSDKYHRGLLVIAVDRPGFDLDVQHFDPIAKKPFVKLQWVSNPDAPAFKRFTDTQGHQFLVGSISEGEGVIVSYYFNIYGMCFDAETYHFYVKAGSYNFLGHFDDGPSQQYIVEALSSGSIGIIGKEQYARDYPIIGRKLEGFTPGESLPETKSEVGQMIATALGHPVEVLTPAMGKTNYNTSANPLGRSICSPWSPGAERNRPDPSKPAVIEYIPNPAL